MKKYTLFTLLILSSPSFAKECAPLKPAPCPCKPAWSFYGGFGAGLTYLNGNWNLVALTQNGAATNNSRTTKQHLSDRSGRFELYFGSSWKVPKTGFGLGLEPYFSYSNLKQSDFNPVVVGNVLGVNIFDSIAQTLSLPFSLGLDFRPSYRILDSSHSVYGLLGASVAQLTYTFQDQASAQFKRNKYPWAFNWGLGYEYRLSSSALGFRFREELYNQQVINFGDRGTNFRIKAKPRTYSYMLTYTYYFQ